MGLARVVLDASVVIGTLDATDNSHEAATKQLLATSGCTRIVAGITRSEILVSYARKGQLTRGHADLDGLRIYTAPALAGSPGLDLVERTEAWSDLVASIRAETGLKTPDAVVLATAILVGGSVVTIDKKLAAAAANRGRLFEPPADTP